MRSRKNGFTLIEICMVVLLIGILVSIAVPNIMNARDSATTKGCISNLSEIDSAKELIKVDLKLQDNVVPTISELAPMYIKNFPLCPMGGKYSINAIITSPTCSFPKHVLPN